MDLIPGIPYDIALRCLFRVHCVDLCSISSVCKAWKLELQSPQFWRCRTQFWRCRKQISKVKKDLILLRCENDNIIKLILLEPETRIWSELPPIPDFPGRVPSGYTKQLDFRVGSFRWGFVVVGFKPSQGCTKVYVFDYLSGAWRRGTDMPNEQLYVYSCTSDRDRMVCVLFQRDRFTVSTMVYDVMKDEWSSRTDVRIHGNFFDRMQGMIYQSGKIYFLDPWVRGGNTVFDVSTWQWEEPLYSFFDCWGYEMCLSDDRDWYPGSFVVRYKNNIWEGISLKLETGRVDYLITWKSKLMVIPNRYDGDAYETRLFDLKNHKCTTFDRPKQFTGRIQTGCYLEI